MLGGVVRISNGVRSSGAVKRLFGSSTALRSANPTGPEVQKCCEIYVAKAKDEGKKFLERLASNKFSWKDMAVAIVAIDASLYTVVKCAGYLYVD